MASIDSRTKGSTQLDSIVHEASHTVLYDDNQMFIDMARDARQAGFLMPADFWHALLFYTAGESTRTELARHGVLDYVAYADKNGLWKGPWQSYRSALSLFWQPHMDGKLSAPRTLSKIVDALAVGDSTSKQEL